MCTASTDAHGQEAPTCKGGSSQTKSTVDPRIYQLGSSNFNRAQAIANRPYQPYTGELVAPITPAQNQGFDAITSGALNAGQPALTSAVDTTSGLQNFQAPAIRSANANGQGYTAATYQAPTVGPLSLASATQATGGLIDPNSVPDVTAKTGLSGLGSYMNPYTQNVIDTTMADLERQRQMAQVSDAQKASAAGAFGGSRSGVLGALTNDAYDRNAASTLAGLNQQGFNTATGLLQNDQNRQLQAYQGNQQTALSIGGQNAGLAQQLGLANAQAQDAASSQNASAGNALSQFIASLGAQAGATNAAAQNQALQFGASAQNAASLQNAQQKQAAALANQQAQQQAAQTRLQAANQAGQLSAQQLQQLLTAAGAVSDVGAAQQAQQQAVDTANYGQYQAAQQYPITMQQLLNNTLGGLTGAKGTQETVQTDQGGILGGVGSLFSGVGALGTPGASGASAFGNILGALGALSDERAKTDIRTVRYDKKGRRWVTFRYLWDDPDTLRYGLIAQEVMKTDPQAVIPTTPYLSVDYTKLEAA